MILVCPSCETRYKVDDTSLGEAGRQVKCARCANVWHADNQPQEPPPVKIDTRAAEIFNSSGESWSDGKGQTDMDDSSAFPPVADLSVSREEPKAEAADKRGKRSGAGWALLVLTIAGTVLAGYAARNQLIEAWPPAAKLYDTLGIEHDGPQIISNLAGGGLVLEDIQSTWDQSDDKMVLTVSGTIANRSNIERPVPALVIWLESEDERQLQSWSLTVETKTLAPGETAPFETSIDDPVEEAMRVEVAVMDG